MAAVSPRRSAWMTRRTPEGLASTIGAPCARRRNVTPSKTNRAVVRPVTDVTLYPRIDKVCPT